MPDSPQEIDVDGAVRSFFPLADWWANRIQWCEDDHQDLVQEGMLWLVATLRGYNRSGKEIRDLPALAGTCFSAAMKWWYKKGDRKFHFVSIESIRKTGVDSKTPFKEGFCLVCGVELHHYGPQQTKALTEEYYPDFGLTCNECRQSRLTTAELSVDKTDRYIGGVFVDQFLTELEKVHGAVARKIVEQMIEPSEELGQVALASMEKKRKQKEAGERVIGYGSPRIHQHHIREAVGLDTKQWDKTINNIKVFAKEYMCRSPESVNGHLRKGPTEQPPSSKFHSADSTMR